MRKEKSYMGKNIKLSKLDLRLKRYKLRGKNRKFFEGYYNRIKEINELNNDCN